MLKACLNGARRPLEHPALPVTAAELSHDALAVQLVGVDALHVHVKDDSGADTLDAGRLAGVLDAVRAAVPLPVGVTTGAWTLPDPAARVAAIRSWTVLPDFASVNWHETGADDVAAALLDRGIGVEAGLWHAAGAGAWAVSPHRDRCLRLLIELADGLDAEAVDAEAARLLELVASFVDESGTPLLLHGEGTSTWPALRTARDLGLSTRIGLEDTLELPDGSPASGNVALVRAARELLDAVGQTRTTTRPTMPSTAE